MKIQRVLCVYRVLNRKRQLLSDSSNARTCFLIFYFLIPISIPKKENNNKTKSAIKRNVPANIKIKSKMLVQ